MFRTLPSRRHFRTSISIHMLHMHILVRPRPRPRRFFPFLQHIQSPSRDGKPFLRWAEGVQLSEDEKLKAVHALLRNDFNKMTPINFVLRLLGHNSEFKSIKDGFYASQAVPNFLNVISKDRRGLKNLDKSRG